MSYNKVPINSKEDCNIVLQNLINAHNNGNTYPGLEVFARTKIFVDFLKQKTLFLDNINYQFKIKSSQRIWHIAHNDTQIPLCYECKINYAKFDRLLTGYCKACSKECKYGKERTKNYENTCYKIYGVTNVTKLPQIIQKIEQTNMDRFGVYNYAQTTQCHEQIKQTSLDKYGTEHPSQNESVKQKNKNTSIKNFKEGHYSRTKEAKDTFKKTNLIKYGVENPMQNQDIFNKNLKSRKQIKEYIMPSGDVVKIQGYENRTIDLLLKSNYNENDLIISTKEINKHTGKIIYIDKDNKQHKYYPDLFCISENKIYETKSDYIFTKELEKNFQKRKACLDMGFNFEFYIFDAKGNLLNENDILSKIIF
jgi:hypothetical protein